MSSIDEEIDKIVDDIEQDLPEFCVRITRIETYYIRADNADQATAIALGGEGLTEEQMTVEVHENLDDNMV